MKNAFKQEPDRDHDLRIDRRTSALVRKNNA